MCKVLRRNTFSSSLMSFLDDLGADASPVSESVPFLDEDPILSKKSVDVPNFLSPNETSLRDGDSPYEAPSHIVNGHLADLNERGNGSQHVALSSAEELHFSDTSLNHKKWDLYRTKILGKGSFGCATLYTMASSSYSVVVKDINIQTMTCREEEMTALQNEVTALQRAVGHPNALQLFDYHHDEAGMMAYIITEFCEGGDVGGALEKVKQCEYIPPKSNEKSYRPTKQHFFEENIVASILIQVVVALHHLHVESRILHRDLKPQNLFLLKDGITVRIGDFGIVALLNTVGDVAKDVCGSPLYMAPEVCSEKPHDGAADVWSLGVLLYEIMAQSRPFNAASMTALTQMVMKGKCTPLWERTLSNKEGSETLPYSRELMELVMSMLTVDPKGRPTLRRLLRSRYIRAHLHTVPKSALASKDYKKLFDESEYEEGLARCIYEGTIMEIPESKEKAVHDEDYYEDDFEDEA